MASNLVELRKLKKNFSNKLEKIKRTKLKVGSEGVGQKSLKRFGFREKKRKQKKKAKRASFPNERNICPKKKFFKKESEHIFVFISF